jgi:hypothetical protein
MGPVCRGVRREVVADLGLDLRVVPALLTRLDAGARTGCEQGRSPVGLGSVQFGEGVPGKQGWGANHKLAVYCQSVL